MHACWAACKRALDGASLPLPLLAPPAALLAACAAAVVLLAPMINAKSYIQVRCRSSRLAGLARESAFQQPAAQA